MLLYIAVNILKLFHIVDMFDCPSTNLYKFQSLFEAIFIVFESLVGPVVTVVSAPGLLYFH